MVLLKAYKRVEKPLDQIPDPYRFRSGLDWSHVKSALSNGYIKDFVVYVEGGRVKGQKGSSTKPFFDVEWRIPEEKRDGFVSQLASRASSTKNKEDSWGDDNRESRLWFARTLNLGGRDLSYEAHYDQGKGAITIRLPQQILATASGSHVNGYVYGRNLKDERERFFDETILPLERDVRSMGFARKVTRFNQQCMTTLCFEPMDIDVDRLKKIIHGFMEAEDVQTNYDLKECYAGKHPERATRWHLSVEDPATMRATFFGNKHDSADKVRELYDMGFEILDTSQVEYNELYSTWFGRQIDNVLDGICKRISSLKKLEPAFVDEIRRARETREYKRVHEELEKTQRMEAWLKRYAPSPNADTKEGCIIIVDPVCEMKVVSGTDPLEKDGAAKS